MGEREDRLRRYYPMFVIAQLLPTILLTAWILDARIAGTDVGFVLNVWLLLVIPILLFAYRHVRVQRNAPERWAFMAVLTNLPFAVFMGVSSVEYLDVRGNTLVTFVTYVSAGVLSALVPWAMAWSAARFVRRA